jgi:hypothetical protein
MGRSSQARSSAPAGRVLIGPRSRAVFARATRDRIDIELLAGAVAIDAAHVARRPFTVEVGSSRVHVVGTAFRVERAQREVTVAVARGRVRVEVPGGASTFVGAGERLVMGAEPLPAPKPALTPADQQAFAPLGILVDPLPAPGAANASRSADLEPRKGTDDTGKRKRARPSRPPEGSQPGGPQARPPEIARSEPRSSEEEFLAWAEAAVATGGCPHYLTGLADIAEWSQDARARERARILRARCYDALGVRGRANLEYRRYLEEYRFGSFAAEADGALER